MRRRRRQSLPDTPFTLSIEKLSHEGRGIAHLDGKVVFVEGALPGESVDAQLVSRRDSFDEAKLVTVHEESVERIEPPCEYSAICGGCSLQHFEGAAQLRFKEAMLLEKLRHETPDHDFTVLEPLTGPAYGYRRKARLAVRYVHKKGQVLVGFREKHSTFITHMSSCEVLDSRIAHLLPALSELIGGLKAFRFIPQIEVAAGDPEMAGCTVALVFRHLQPLPESDLESLRTFASDNDIALYLQPGGVDSVHRLFPNAGVDRLYYNLPDFDLGMAFHPVDFTQVNGEINQKMISRALSLLALDSSDVVLDLFCGLGNFTLPIARHCGTVVGVEGAQAMVERARENTWANGIENAEFHCADLSKSIEGSSWFAKGFTRVMLDPPRSGAIDILPDIIKLRPSRIVYVSCNPATLARDAGFLVSQGYSLDCAGVMDMFPQTAHVEAMALFTDSSHSRLTT